MFCLAERINALGGKVDLLYTDEDKIDEDGNRFNPYFKPDWNRALFLQQNFIAHLGCYRTAIAKEIGGFRAGFEGSQDYDFALRFIARISESESATSTGFCTIGARFRSIIRSALIFRINLTRPRSGAWKSCSPLGDGKLSHPKRWLAVGTGCCRSLRTNP